MKLLSWLPTYASHSSDDSPFQAPSLKHYASDASTNAALSPSSSNETSNSNSSLHSDLSLQTLPSVPSLQNLSPKSLKLSVSHQCLLSLTPNPLPYSITCLTLHGKLLYAAFSHQINVYDRTTYSLLDSFNGGDPSSGSVKFVAFADGKIFTGHQDCKIKVWQLTAANRHKLLATLPTVNDYLRKFILPKNYVTIRRHKKRLWIEHTDAVSGIAVNNGLIYSVSWDKCLKMWRASDRRCLESVKAHDDAINSVVVSRDGTVYTGSADRRIRVWAKPAGEKRHVLIATLEKHKSAVNALALNDDGSVLFSGACDRSILVWEREDTASYMVVTGALRGHDKAILCLVNVCETLFSGSADRTVRIWRRGYDEKYCCLTVLEGHQKPVKSLVAVMDGECGDAVSVFSGSLDGEIKVWRVSLSSLNSSSSSPSHHLKLTS